MSSAGRRAQKLNVKPKRPEPYVLDKARGFEIVWPQVSPLLELARRIQNRSFVYVIGEEGDGPVKIGSGKDPIVRLRTMQIGNPRRLRIEYVLLGTLAIEKLLQEMWEHLAIISAAKRGKVDAAPGTEWFKAEIRAELFPIMATAAEKQIDYVAEVEEIVSLEHLESIIRDAHAAHDFVFRKRDQVLLLARGAGHVLASRPSRI